MLRVHVKPTLVTAPDGDPAARAAERTDVRRALALPVGQRQALVLTEWLGLDSADAGTCSLVGEDRQTGTAPRYQGQGSGSGKPPP
jgi:hypothetical protein